MTATQDRQGPRRVAQIIGQLTTGGAELQLSELVRRLDRSRYEPFVYCLTASSGPVASRLAKDGVPVRYIGSIGLTRAHRLANALRDDRIDLVHSWLFLANTYAWAAGWYGFRAPLVTSARNCKSQGRLHHAANIAAFRRSSRVLVNSAEVRDFIIRHYRADRGRIDVVYNGVDVERFHPGPGPTGPPTIVTAGRLVEQKNPSLFVEAAARLRRLVPEVRFQMIGNGRLRERIGASARAVGLADALEIQAERNDVEVPFRAASLFWLTSSWEGLPNVVLEAMASGLPVIATDVGGTRELVRSGREGFIVRPDDANGFVRHSAALLADSKQRELLGAAARQRALRFSFESMVAGTQAVYAHSLGN